MSISGGGSLNNRRSDLGNGNGNNNSAAISNWVKIFGTVISVMVLLGGPVIWSVFTTKALTAEVRLHGDRIQSVEQKITQIIAGDRQRIDRNTADIQSTLQKLESIQRSQSTMEGQVQEILRLLTNR